MQHTRHKAENIKMLMSTSAHDWECRQRRSSIAEGLCNINCNTTPSEGQQKDSVCNSESQLL